MSKKIAIIGNMNNNGFALMRYFRDLGWDAHLFLYSNDGVGSLEHFSPKNDSFEFEKWSSYIHQTNIFNGSHHTIPDIFGLIASGLYNFRQYLKFRKFRLENITEKYLRQKFSDFEIIIASGYAPAILLKADIVVDIFFPYAAGVEGIHRFYAPKKLLSFSRALYEWGRVRQIFALRRARNIVNADLSMTAEMLNSLNLRFKSMSVPMVYLDKFKPASTGDLIIDKACRDLQECDISLLMHSRLAWNPDVCLENSVHPKNNNWIINSVKKLIETRPGKIVKIAILEYGPDVKNTKKLVSELGIESHVIWLPKTSRKNIMHLLDKVTIGVGEFINMPRMFWGGTGWEVLASGKPLLQGFQFNEGEFDELYGYPPPPMLPVVTEDDVLKHLLFFADHGEEAVEIGTRAREWFHTHNGIALAKRWLALVTDLTVSSKSIH